MGEDYVYAYVIAFLVVFAGFVYFATVANRRTRHIRKLKKQISELSELARTDSLTGLLTRREFSKVSDALYALLPCESEKQRKRSESLSVVSTLVIDLDHFKQINDLYGHLNGDEVLRKVSATIKECLREKDPVCRWGGEEIVVALPGASGEVAERLAEDIRTAISELWFASGIKVTASIGVACAYYRKDAEKLIGWADQAVYEAKDQGRNRVVIYNTECN